MPNMYAKYESVLSRSMVAQALTDPAVRSVLIEIAAQLRRDIMPVIRRAVLAEHDLPTLSPALRSMFSSLAMQHSAGDKFVGALLPHLTQEYLENTVEGRELLLTAIDNCLCDADKIQTPNQFLSLMKSIDGMAFAYGTDIFLYTRTCSDYESIKEYISPTREEVGIRSLRADDIVAVTYGISTEQGSDLVLKKDVTNSCRSGKARFFISSPESRHRTWFEQLADQSKFSKPPLPLIASPSNAAAKSFIMAHGIGLFTRENSLFNLEKAQVFANCLMAYLVYCGHHSFLEVMEIWNRQLDFLVIERSNQLPAGMIKPSPSIIPYFVDENAVEKKLPYGKIGDYASFFHPAYAHIVANRAEAYLNDGNLDLRFNKRLIILSNPNFSGDNNQLQGISMALTIEIEKQVVSEADFNVATLMANDAVLVSGSHGLQLIHAIKTAQPKSFVIWVGHQWFDALTQLKVWPDLIALPKSACKAALTALIPVYVKLIGTDGVAHCVNEATVKADLNQFKGAFPNNDQFTSYVGIIIAGDAPTPDGKMKYFNPVDAKNSAQDIIKHIKSNGLGHKKTAFIIVNGPRTGKHDPENGAVIMPEPHRSHMVDLSSQAFVEVFKCNFPQQVFFYDFQFGETSAYKPAMDSVRKAKQSAWYVPAESSSMVTESTFLSSYGVPVIIYCPRSANETHMALVEEACANGLVSMLTDPISASEKRIVHSAAHQIAVTLEKMLLTRNPKKTETVALSEAIATHSVFALGDKDQPPKSVNGLAY